MAILEPVEPSAAPPPAPPFDTMDPASLAAIVEAHQRSVWRYLRLLGADPHEADDLMQDTFVCYARGRRDREAVTAVGSFLLGIARNLLFAARRRARRCGPNAEWTAAVDLLAEDDPSAFADDRIEALRTCVSLLRGRARQAVEWHHLEGLSSRDTGARLGIGDEGVKSLLARARAALRACVDRRIRGDRS